MRAFGSAVPTALAPISGSSSSSERTRVGTLTAVLLLGGCYHLPNQFLKHRNLAEIGWFDLDHTEAPRKLRKAVRIPFRWAETAGL
jgi:hypothetical protein